MNIIVVKMISIRKKQVGKEQEDLTVNFEHHYLFIMIIHVGV